MEQAQTSLMMGLDHLPTQRTHHERPMLRLIASRRTVGSHMRGCETILLGNAMDGNEDSLGELIQRVCDGDDAFETINNAGIVCILQLEGFCKMQSLPDNLDRLFPNVINIHVVNCPKFSSLSTAVAIRHLTHISCTECTSLTSMTSLSTMPIDSQLETLSFNGCGLTVTRDDDWGPGMEALARAGRTTQGFLSISISGCESLTRLPSSIGKLKDTIRDRVLIYLRRNINLSHIPHELGDVTNLKTLGIENCPKISQLPWTLSRLNASTCIDLSNTWGLISNMGMTKTAKAFGPPFLTIDPTIPYFSNTRKKFYHGLFWLIVHFGRARKRAIERLYAPGGTRYEESRERFEEAILVW
eukprot:CAMPEP_0201868050 /NCGR_PEP_ID=MMETSP0902-20130614/2093_1 /ASSEMBLY_ACC=CAM_ASM_000551 /TAXON_ID=420261 /ORGANISM="Thalassiosira antarctica, Strain CCMP982" /LENGTH=356 /DNA_ID=CAMNT_0048393339 /DNA_START=214 /DNA_END=1281 /DNA_ORIENTATION=-